jgi:hypothetical protein
MELPPVTPWSCSSVSAASASGASGFVVGLLLRVSIVLVVVSELLNTLGDDLRDGDDRVDDLAQGIAEDDGAAANLIQFLLLRFNR